MMTTVEQSPALPLSDYIRCYSLRDIDTEGEELPRHIHAIDQMFMTFWLSNTPLVSHTPSLFSTINAVQQVNLRERPLLGLQTSFKGHLAFNGKYRFFSVEFIANGFFRIFNIPVYHLSDRLLHSDDVIGHNVQFLQEQLEEAIDMQEMVKVANQFFLKALLKNQVKSNTDSITAASNAIQKCHNPLNIKALANQVNMSLRGLERHFTEQIGIPPKLLIRIVRFNKVLQSKMIHPDRSWTNIANSYDYFDQMHLIKEFKLFTGHSPNSFLRQLPIPMRERFGKEIN
ncbi:AraC family transcriptional regulator [Pedobacter foliorum]|uniref:helix-turn-helix domain-containing protein n=1 Tax=Pedobacter foliorum TaxID=2739058 RepID=UPI001566DF72|nr:helix-turn-helix domain-containing protein [Pedobacter foliorum]NRF37363.1 AraC family transcriptional regulator [Pedobacter foliorum]